MKTEIKKRLFRANTDDNVLFQFCFTLASRCIFQRVKNPETTLKRFVSEFYFSFISCCASRFRRPEMSRMYRNKRPYQTRSLQTEDMAGWLLASLEIGTTPNHSHANLNQHWIDEFIHCHFIDLLLSSVVSELLSERRSYYMMHRNSMNQSSRPGSTLGQGELPPPPKLRPCPPPPNVTQNTVWQIQSNGI